MKKKFLSTLLPLSLFAQSFMVSSIPLPKTYIENLDPYGCDTQCLEELLENGQVFSFLAYTQDGVEDSSLSQQREMQMAILNVRKPHSHATFKVAMMLPAKKIGKYAASTTNAVFSYLLNQNNSFSLQSYNLEDETPLTLKTTLQQIQNDGFRYVIAPLTSTGAKALVETNTQLHIYVPTIH